MNTSQISVQREFDIVYERSLRYKILFKNNQEEQVLEGASY